MQMETSNSNNGTTYNNGTTNNNNKGLSGMIMIQNSNTKNNNTKINSILIYQQGDKMAQCNINENKSSVDKTLIDKTVKQLRKSIDNSSTNRLETEMVHRDTQPNGITYYPSQQTRDNQPTAMQTTTDKHLISEDTGSKTEKDNLNKHRDSNTNTNDRDDRGRVIILNTIHSDEQSFGFKTCLICDKAFPIHRLINAEGCFHTFCVRCAKNYYEDKLEQGDPTLKCAVYSCKKAISIEVMSHIISSSHYKTFSDDTHYLNVDFEETRELKKPYQRKLEMMKIYTQKNVLDVNSNETMYFYSKAKILFCPECAEMALFGKSGTHFIKCLNCFHSMCRYCLKSYTQSHMDITTDEHCKVYYRKGDSTVNTRGRCMTFLIELFFIIAGFLFMIIGSYAYMTVIVNWLTCSKGCGKVLVVKWIRAIFAIVLWVISLPIILLSFPYYPVIVSIFK